MPKNSVAEWDATAANNTDVAGVNIAEGAPAAGMNDALRAMMAQVRAFYNSILLAGTGGSQARTNDQNDARFARLASANTLTAQQTFSHVGGQTAPTISFTNKEQAGALGMYGVPQSTVAGLASDAIRATINSTAAMEIVAAGTSAPTALTAMTREKGDARYVNSGSVGTIVGGGYVNGSGVLSDQWGVLTSISQTVPGSYTLTLTAPPSKWYPHFTALGSSGIVVNSQSAFVGTGTTVQAVVRAVSDGSVVANPFFVSIVRLA